MHLTWININTEIILTFIVLFVIKNQADINTGKLYFDRSHRLTYE